MSQSQYSIETILESMHELFQDYPLTELNYETPFQCLIAVMMSAQTTDVQVNKVTNTLFKKIKTPADVLRMGEKELGEYIKTVGLRTSKKKNIYRTATLLTNKTKEKGDFIIKINGRALETDCIFKNSQEVLDECGYYIPDTIEEMLNLPGVGIKTAKVVLYVLYRQRRVAVDTHVHRVMNRLSVVNTKTPIQTSKLLEDIIPDDYKDIAHHSVIYFGRYLCKAKKPECERCPLQAGCKRYKDNVFFKE